MAREEARTHTHTHTQMENPSHMPTGLADDGKRWEVLDVAFIGDSSSIDSISLFASFSLCVRLARIGGWRMTGSALTRWTLH